MNRGRRGNRELSDPRNGRFVAVVVGCGAATITASLIAVVTAGPIRLIALALILAALFVVAEHRDRVYSDETGMSGSIAVGLCAATYLASQGWTWGTFVVCAAGAFYVPHVRSRSGTKIVVNAMCFGSSGVTAALVVNAIAPRSQNPNELVMALAAISAAITYWVCNSTLLGLATASLDGRSFPRVAWELVRSETAMLAFAFGGAICGLVMVEVSRWTGIAALVALLIALDVFVISVPAGPATLRSAWKMIVSRVVGAAVGGVVGAAVPKVLASAFVGALVGGVLGLAAGLATVTLVALVRLRRSGAYLDRTVLVGFVLAEVALPAIGTAAGVVGALAGLGPGIATAAGLVIAASFVAGWRRRATNDDGVDDDLLLAAVTEAMFDGLPHPANRT